MATEAPGEKNTEGWTHATPYPLCIECGDHRSQVYVAAEAQAVSILAASIAISRSTPFNGAALGPLTSDELRRENEMNYGDTALLGIDVGFSKSRPTTGIAWSANGTFGAAKTHTDWDRRRQYLPTATTYSVIAIDGPLVPAGSPALLVRMCEQTLARGAFQKRCKPGSSHFGTGLQLKRAALETAEQIKHLASAPMFENAVFGDAAIVEAFPNAFLGVLMPEQTFGTTQILRRRKFDWMYEHVIEAGRLAELMAFVGWDAPEFLQSMQTERDHERRAAYICLLTAACAVVEKAKVVGDVAGGWIWLPPTDLWASWARTALDQNLARADETLGDATFRSSAP
jgi:hypothetical protein